MSKPILILMDDVHLEGREIAEQERFADDINFQISEIKEAGNIPIVICAGDIGEGIAGIQWASKFKADVIYICGNHEFWGQDYYNVSNNINEFIKNGQYTNLHFLHNRTIELYGIRFIGSTLWTDMGDFLPWYNKNHIIKFYAAMGDFKKIKASSWYSSQNEVRLKTFLNAQGVEDERIKDLIQNQSFNPLLEKEENHIAIEFLLQELGSVFDGKTVIVSHHLPIYDLWMKKKKMPNENILGEFLNNERQFYEAAKGNDNSCRDVLMMGYYANDLEELMYSEFAPDYWLHGHLHQSMSDIVGRTKIISSPVGYQKQSADMKYKLIDLSHNKGWLSNYVKEEIEDYDWNENLLKTLRDLEKMITKFELATSVGMLSALDFESILKNYQEKHIQNLNGLKAYVNNWIKLFVYDKNPELINKNIDFYITMKESGILDMKFSNNGKPLDIKYKFPETLAAAINENSFLDEISYKEKNRNNLQYYHYKEWMKELQKIQIQISQYKKMLIEYCDEYKK